MIWLIIALFSNVIEQLLIVHVMSSMDMVTYITLFYLFSSIFTVAYHFRLRAKTTQKAPLIHWEQFYKNKMMFMGYVGGAFFGNLFWFCAVLMIGVGMTSFILIFIKILTTSYSYVFMQDRFPIDKIVSFCIGIFALFIFSFSGDDVNLTGIILALLSCFGFAGEVICRKKLVDKNVNPENAILMRTLSISILWIFIFICGVIWGSQSFDNITSIDITSFMLLLITALLGGFLVHLFVFFGMKNVQISKYNALATLKPILLVLGGVYFFAETITITQIIAGAVIILSTFYFLRGKNTP